MLIAAAGNSELDRDHDKNLWIIPADCPAVIAVSATATPSGWVRHLSSNFLDDPASYSGVRARRRRSGNDDQ